MPNFSIERNRFEIIQILIGLSYPNRFGIVDECMFDINEGKVERTIIFNLQDKNKRDATKKIYDGFLNPSSLK